MAVLLVAAFLAHDGWMAHAGHIVYVGAADASAMGETAHAGHHRAAGFDVPPSRTEAAVIAVIIPMPPLTMTCETLRAGTLGHPTNSPSPVVSLAVLPMVGDVSERADQEGRADWRPPGQAPDVRRALLQVYRE